MILKPQAQLVFLIKQKLTANESIGSVISELLDISTDAAYRRVRCEKPIGMDELALLCKHFNISLDQIFEIPQKTVVFDFYDFDKSNFSLDVYLLNIRDSLLNLKNQNEAKLILTINNTHFFQLFNFPELVKFKLFFWMKMNLQLDEFQKVKYTDFRFSQDQLNTCNEILNLYNSIPSVEIYDVELFGGLAREVYYYSISKELEDLESAKLLFESINELIDHLCAQAKNAKKFKVNTPVPASDRGIDVYVNEILNSVASFYYETEKNQGLFVAHNFMNSLHTNNQYYVNQTKDVLDSIIEVSTKISHSNHKLRNNFFGKLIENVNWYKQKTLNEFSVQSR